MFLTAQKLRSLDNFDPPTEDNRVQIDESAYDWLKQNYNIRMSLKDSESRNSLSGLETLG
jgi:hypothetical protein